MGTLFNESNTIQCEELASQGYIVLVYGHIGEGTYCTTENVISKPNPELVAKFWEEIDVFAKNALEYVNWFESEGKNQSIIEIREKYAERYKGQTFILERLEAWVQDGLIALDGFLEMNKDKDSIFFNKIDDDKIATLGMSFGGVTALNLPYRSNKIKACANLDGLFYSICPFKAIEKPLLYMQNGTQETRNHGIFAYATALDDAYSIIIKNSNHMNYMDYSEIIEKDGPPPMLGEVDGGFMEDTINDVLTEFFNKYLFGKDTPKINALEGDSRVIVQKNECIGLGD